MEALTESGWNPSVSIDITLEPKNGEEIEPRPGEVAHTDRDTEFLNSIGIAAMETRNQ
jgi:hypothetical protein